MMSGFSGLENTFALMDELRRRMDRVWEDVDPSWQRHGPSARSLTASGFPRVNLFDDGASLVVTADVPGLSDKDIQVTLHGGGLAIAGERRVVPPEGYAAHRQERTSVKFSRVVALPCKVDPERTTATVKDGVLTVTLAKSAEAQPRQITVRTS